MINWQRVTDVLHHKQSKNMQFVALGATAGVGGCQTLGQVSEQMDSLLDRQSSQRILPNESCLLAKGENRVQGHTTWQQHLSGGKLLNYTSTLKSALRLTHHI